MSNRWAYKKSTLSRKILRPLLHAFVKISQIFKIFKICKCPTEVCILSHVYFSSVKALLTHLTSSAIFAYCRMTFKIFIFTKRTGFVVVSLCHLCRDVWCDENEVDIFAQSRRPTHKLKQFTLLSHRNAVTAILEDWIKIVTFNKASYMYTINKISLT